MQSNEREGSLKNRYLWLFVVVLFGSSCGVKNDPVAPASPDEIGRGKPLYKSPTFEPESSNKKEKSDEEN